MPNPYRLMWMMVFYDLPTRTPGDRRAATRFHKFLLDQGFEMAQFSVYRRFCGGQDRWDTFRRRVEANLPGRGEVRILAITDRQFGAMRIYDGRVKKREGRTQPAQFALF